MNIIFIELKYSPLGGEIWGDFIFPFFISELCIFSTIHTNYFCHQRIKMIYFKMQHLDSSEKLPSYIFVLSQREESHGETIYNPTIFCVMFELGMF